MVKNIQSYRDQFLMIKQCKDTRVRNKQLGVLMTEMENEFEIPAFKDAEYNKSHPVIVALYKDVSNARWQMEIIQITQEEAVNIINTRQPLGLFYVVTKNSLSDAAYTGIINDTGEAWTEDFYTISGCMAWLRGEMEA